MKKNKSLFKSLLDMICTRKEEIKISKLEEDIKRVRKHREKIKFNGFTEDEMVEIDQWRALAKEKEEAKKKYKKASLIFDVKNTFELDQEVDDDALGTWMKQFKNEDWKEDEEEVKEVKEKDLPKHGTKKVRGRPLFFPMYYGNQYSDISCYAKDYIDDNEPLEEYYLKHDNVKYLLMQETATYEMPSYELAIEDFYNKESEIL
tara:strand:- start:3120 stop:3731 length:612 start_codon:yes stop_codon:yes gene_type:complete